jgi:hypothetical protein
VLMGTGTHREEKVVDVCPYLGLAGRPLYVPAGAALRPWSTPRAALGCGTREGSDAGFCRSWFFTCVGGVGPHL